MQAGKLVKPEPKEVVVLKLEQFDVKTRKWQHKGNLELAIESTKFDSGAFRDAYKGEEIKKQDGKIWVVQTYNEKATNTIRDDQIEYSVKHTLLLVDGPNCTVSSACAVSFVYTPYHAVNGGHNTRLCAFV